MQEVEISYIGIKQDINHEKLIKTVIETCMKEEKLNNLNYYISITLTNPDEIRKINKEYRNIDKETDVLSFPNVDFEREGVFHIEDEREADYFDPDSGELILGDIMISVDKVKEQAESYGHSLRREFAFLIAHSMLHLCGYDHMEENQAHVREKKQEEILAGLGITRDGQN